MVVTGGMCVRASHAVEREREGVVDVAQMWVDKRMQCMCAICKYVMLLYITKINIYRTERTLCIRRE